MKSVCFFVWRGFKSFDLLVKSLAKLFRNFVVEPKSGDNGNLASHLAIGSNSGAGRGQAYDVLASPVTASGNAINYSFPTFCQVHEHRFVGATQVQLPTLLFVGADGILRSVLGPVESGSAS